MFKWLFRRKPRPISARDRYPEFAAIQERRETLIRQYLLNIIDQEDFAAGIRQIEADTDAFLKKVVAEEQRDTARDDAHPFLQSQKA